MATTRMERRQAKGKPSREDESWVHSVALVSVALKKDSAEALLACLAEDHVEVASARLSAVTSLSRAARQALLASEFGCRVDAAEEVRRLSAELTGPLREEVLRQLPSFISSGHVQAQGAAPEPLMGLGVKWARRLAREASLTGPRPSGS